MITQHLLSRFSQRPSLAKRDPLRALFNREIVLELLVGLVIYMVIAPRYNLAVFYYADCRSAWWPVTGEALIPALIISVFVNLLILRPAIRYPERGFWRQLVPATVWSLVGGGLGGLAWTEFYYNQASIICRFWPGHTTDFLRIGIALGLGFGLSALLSACSGRTRTQHTFRFARRVIYLLIPVAAFLLWFGVYLGVGLNSSLGINRPVPGMVFQTVLIILGMLLLIYIALVIAAGLVWLADYWGRAD